MENRICLLWGKHGRMEQGQKMREHYHSCFQLYYILAGAPTYRVADLVFTAQSGSYFVIPASVPHSMDALDSRGADSYEFKLLIHDPFIAEHFLAPSLPMTDSGVIGKLLKYVIENWTSPAAQNVADIENILLTTLLSFFVDQLDYQERDSRFVFTSDYDKLTKDALIYIESHYHRAFSLDQLAAALNYNKNYLSSVFRKNTGYAVIDYVNLLRIRNAIIHIYFYDQDVSSTCECVGFNDISYFSRTFKRFTGVCPRRFKTALHSLLAAEPEKRSLLEKILNYQICSIDEAFEALRRLSAFCSE